ncbi:MAG TPA: transcriptional regulator [Aldersonia sp.]
MNSPVTRTRRSAVRRHRPALILLVVVAAAGCLVLGWWQWTRFEAAGGTGQNLGYALQWPLFAAFVVYAYRRFVQLEADREEADGADSADGAALGRVEAPREIPEHLLPPRPTGRVADDLDETTAEYNRYLAELSSHDARDANSQESEHRRSTP